MGKCWWFIAGVVLLAGNGLARADKASINVRVPEFADVWVVGEKTHLLGTSRDFETPDLDPGRRYLYEIRARWIEEGVVIDVTRKIGVRSGDNLRVDFHAGLPRTESTKVAPRSPARERTPFYVDITEDVKVPPAAAMIKVHVPNNAEVWLSGEKQHQPGTVRKYMTKPLEDDKSYTAEVRAKWKEDGLEVNQTRKVELHPGDRVTVDFMKQSRKPTDDTNP